MPTDSPSTDSSKRANLPSLTGLRFFAALLVFFAHAFLPYSPLEPTAPVNPYGNDTVALALTILFAPAGFVGVSFFFVLSGFVLTWSLRPDEPVPAFWRRRLLKIFPNHLVTWALVMLLFTATTTPARAWLSNLFLVHAWSPDVEVNSSVNIPAWSLSSELLFYLAFPFLIRPILRIAERRLWWWAGATVVGVAMVAVVTRYVIPPGPQLDPVPIPLNHLWFAYYFPPSRIFEFLLGALLARIVLAGRWPRLRRAPLILLAVVGYAAVLVTPVPYNFVLVMIVPIAAIIGSVAAADAAGRRSWLATPLMGWLGAVSFGFYLSQALPIFYIRLALLGERTFSLPVATAVLLGMFLTTLLLGWLLYRFVELPVMRRWGRRRSTPSDNRPVDPPAASRPATKVGD